MALSWLRSVTRPLGPPRRARRSKDRRGRSRPLVEALEDRWLLATVTTLLDNVPGSLRQALLDTPAGGTVDFAPGLSGTITLTGGQLTIAKDLTVAGPGAEVITVSGNNASRVFEVVPAVTVSIAGLTIANGRSSSGGGIFNRGTLSVTASTLSGNSASASTSFPMAAADARGGGIYNLGTLTVTASTLSGNSASASTSAGISSPAFASGGGIANGGTLTVTASTLSGNSADARAITGFLAFARAVGGGIYNFSGTLTVTASTLSGNSADARGDTALPAVAEVFGGGIFNISTLTVLSSTIVGNRVSGGFVLRASGGGIASSGAAALLRNTIVAGNTALTAADVSGPFASQGHNLLGSSLGGSGFHPTDLLNVDPLLGPLQDNGGPTLTHRPLPGSPAVNAGDSADAPATDQRGRPRVAGGALDIGAVELQPDELLLGLVVTFAGGTLTVSGTDADDTLVLTAGPGGLVLLNGLPTGTGATTATVVRIQMAGLGGNDVLDLAGLGAPIPAALDGGAGDDTLAGGPGDDHLLGGAGDDTLSGGGGVNALAGGAGTDRVAAAGDGNFRLTSKRLDGVGVDRLFSIERAALTGGAGNNRLDARKFRAGPVALDGGGGNDVLRGSRFADLLDGGDGDDVLTGRRGDDVLLGGGGDDLLGGGRGADLLDGGDGLDLLFGGRVGAGLLGVAAELLRGDEFLEWSARGGLALLLRRRSVMG